MWNHQRDTPDSRDPARECSDSLRASQIWCDFIQWSYNRNLTIIDDHCFYTGGTQYMIVKFIIIYDGQFFRNQAACCWHFWWFLGVFRRMVAAPRHWFTHWWKLAMIWESSSNGSDSHVFMHHHLVNGAKSRCRRHYVDWCIDEGSL